jgi:hypothetical protein
MDILSCGIAIIPGKRILIFISNHWNDRDGKE